MMGIRADLIRYLARQPSGLDRLVADVVGLPIHPGQAAREREAHRKRMARFIPKVMLPDDRIVEIGRRALLTDALLHGMEDGYFHRRNGVWHATGKQVREQRRHAKQLHAVERLAAGLPLSDYEKELVKALGCPMSPPHVSRGEKLARAKARQITWAAKYLKDHS